MDGLTTYNQSQERGWFNYEREYIAHLLKENG